jgi:serine/threonine protein kinase
MPQRQFDEFETHETIGVGTVGTIYRARDLANDQFVALKVLLPTVSADEIVSARFEREMHILEKLSHPNIVKYFGGGRQDRQLFFAMELVDGGTLKELLAETGRMSWQEVAACGVQICSALQHAHNHGIIHRDLKPSNLLFNTDASLKLTDFGIARDTHSADITDTGLTVGSYAYMSPEQITGDRMVTGKLDLYALGCLIYEMLTGRPPYLGDNFAQIFEQHLRTAPPDPRDLEPDCPEPLARLVQRLMAKDPEERPFNARSVQAELLQMLGESVTDVGEEHDVAAAAAIDRTRDQLARRIDRTKRSRDARQVSWTPLAILLLVVVVIVGAALFFNK